MEKVNHLLERPLKGVFRAPQKRAMVYEGFISTGKLVSWVKLVSAIGSTSEGTSSALHNFKAQGGRASSPGS